MDEPDLEITIKVSGMANRQHTSNMIVKYLVRSLYAVDGDPGREFSYQITSNGKTLRESEDGG